ncbi:NAD-dependent epimerase/dehydratase family protein [Candidatus Altiarchaeota archaeon]
MEKTKILVTGGAGFIGSHIIDRLLAEGNSVHCIDDLSLGRMENMSHNTGNPDFKFMKADLLDADRLSKLFSEQDFDGVFHFAANSDISLGTINTSCDLEKNFMTTFNVLDCMREYEVNNLVFASTSAIYGETPKRLHEDMGPLQPISLYGASKLAAEAYISAYSHLYSIRSWIFRFPNVVGDRTTHGAIYDFMEKLGKDPGRLEVLGDGTQSKQYMYVKDLVEGIMFGWKKTSDMLNVLNLGCGSATTVRQMAEMVVEEMGLMDVKIEYTGGDRGWKGDVPKFEYDLGKIHGLGWKSKYESTEAVRHAIRCILEDRSATK